jgi:rhamnosyltransferase
MSPLPQKKTIGIALLTWRSKSHLLYCLSPLLSSPLKPRILIIDSSSNDGTVELAKKMGVETIVISQSNFNHGLTREYARKQLDTDIVVMMTPDAYAIDEEMLSKLVAPIINNQASVAYARQLPHKGAGFLESFPREFNYPSESHIRSLKDLDLYGVYTYFCSDSCAAYDNRALDKIGGFSKTVTGEDTIATAKLLQKGDRIAYVAEACVYHSHNYTLLEEFKRHFNTGYARSEFKDLLKAPGGDNARGNRYVKELFTELMKKKPALLPYAIAQVGAKWLGYQLGSLRACSQIKNLLSYLKTSEM